MRLIDNKIRRDKYLVSAIMAVYNTETYLDDAIMSVMHQECLLCRKLLKGRGFFQLILIDDGSTDKSGSICDYYSQRYSNVKTIHSGHKGTSAARNIGIDVAEGKYITFPDSDDLITQNTFDKCLFCFEKQFINSTLVTYPVRFFGGIEEYHWTNFRFVDGTKEIDLFEDTNSPQYFTSSSFFRYVDLVDIRFDQDVKNGEDLLFANRVLLKYERPYIGLVSECEYLYRRRTEGELSTIQKSKNTPEYYSPYICDVLIKLANLANDRYGYIPQYIINTINGQLQFRLDYKENSERIKNVVGDLGYMEYVNSINYLLRMLED